MSLTSTIYTVLRWKSRLKWIGVGLALAGLLYATGFAHAATIIYPTDQTEVPDVNTTINMQGSNTDGFVYMPVFDPDGLPVMTYNVTGLQQKTIQEGCTVFSCSSELPDGEYSFLAGDNQSSDISGYTESTFKSSGHWIGSLESIVIVGTSTQEEPPSETATSTTDGIASEQTLDAIGIGLGIICFAIYFGIGFFFFRPNAKYG